MSSKIESKQKEIITDYINNNPFKINYLAIGSANNAKQQFPLFLKQFLNENIRVILIDPDLEDIPLVLVLITKENTFLTEKKTYKKIDYNNLTIFKLNLNLDKFIEIICIKSFTNYIDYAVCDSNDVQFYINLSLNSIINNGILFGYDFSGADLFKLNNYICDYLIKDGIDYTTYVNSVLLDFTYGSNSSCFPDLENTNFPLVIKNDEIKIINVLSVPVKNTFDYVVELKLAVENDKRIEYHLNNYIKYNIKKLKNESSYLFRQYTELHNKRNDDKIIKYMYNTVIENIVDTIYNMLVIVNISAYNREDIEQYIKNNDKYNCFKLFTDLIESNYIS